VDRALHGRLCRILEEGPALRLAILFGSRARGTAHPGSDVDLAILPVCPEISLAEENALGAELELAAGAPVDLVRLDHATAALRWRIARDGLVLVANPPQEASRFLARAGIEHDDVRELEAGAMKRFRARLAGLAPEEPAR
jgi:uncharacterized protein